MSEAGAEQELLRLHLMGMQGYRHLKCAENLSSEAAYPAQLAYPGLVALSALANETAAYRLAGVLCQSEVPRFLMRFEDNQAEQAKLQDWLAELQAMQPGPVPSLLHQLAEVFLGLEELLGERGEQLEVDLPVWDGEDLTLELDSLLRAAEDVREL